jgi:hypothetical protein
MRSAVKGAVFVAFGMLLSTLYWVTQLPDQPVEGDNTCVPVYYSGLECCQ